MPKSIEELEVEINKLKSDISKLIGEVKALQNRNVSLPPTVHTQEATRRGDDYFFSGDGHFIS